MNRTIGVMAGLLLALGASACVSDPSLEFGEDPNQIAVDPDAMFVTYGVQKQALVRFVDDRNRATPAKFEITNVGPGITVTLDDQYRLDVIGSDELKFREVQLQHRYFVNTTADAAVGVNTSFTLSTGGVSKTVSVRVIPANLGSGLSTTAPELAQAVTITAPAGLSFDPQGSVVTVVGTTAAAAIVERTAKSITFVPQPGSSGEVQVTNVTMDYAPTVNPRTLRTTNSITVPAITASPSLGQTTADVGEAVTINAGAGQAFTSASTATFTPGGAAVVVNQTASTLTIIPIPGSSGAATVTGIALTTHQGSSLGTFSRTTTNSITVPAVSSMGLSYSGSTALTPITVTPGDGFKFNSNFNISVGGRAGMVLSVASDGSSAQVVFPTGLDGGTVAVNNVAMTFLPAVNLTGLTSPNSITTTPASVPFGGAAPDGTVATITAAEPGTLVDYFDTGDDMDRYGDDIVGFYGRPLRWYRLVVPSAGSRTYTVGWTSTASIDVDFYVVDDAVTTAYVARETGANPETGATNLAPGNYWIIVSNYTDASYPGVYRISVQ